MPRIEPEALSNPEMVFIAATLREALHVEDVLTTAGVDYVVQVEAFATTILLNPRQGAAFYVASGQASYCRERLMAEGLDLGVVTEQD